MILSDYYTSIKFPISKFNEIIEFSKNYNLYYISRYGNCRADLSADILLELQNMFPFKISDAEIYKNYPEWVYKIHKDANRQFAINMLLTDVNSYFHALCYSEDKITSFPIPYAKNEWVMLNTKQWHSVENKSPNITRFVMSIGCTDVSYYDMRSRLQQ